MGPETGCRQITQMKWSAGRKRSAAMRWHHGRRSMKNSVESRGSRCGRDWERCPKFMISGSIRNSRFVQKNAAFRSRHFQPVTRENRPARSRRHQVAPRRGRPTSGQKLRRRTPNPFDAIPPRQREARPTMAGRHALARFGLFVTDLPGSAHSPASGRLLTPSPPFHLP